MKIISLSGPTKPVLRKTAAAIGIFDGVHRGHQYLIKQMLACAGRLKLKPIVITFFPHPAHVMRPDVKLGYLMALEERLRRLGGMGVAACVVIAFDLRFAGIEPEDFIKNILVGQLGVKAVFVGEDFRFGRDRSGDVALFERLAGACGYEMHAVAALKQGRLPVSSTRIRHLIVEGKLDGAAALLGRRVAVAGRVVKGSQRGRSLGFPTANVAYEADILPPHGVYVVKLLLGKKEYRGMANIGTRPSFDSDGRVYLEVNVLDFSKNIYGQYVEVQFLKKIRNEKKFSHPQALIRQIRRDEAFSRKYFATV